MDEKKKLMVVGALAIVFVGVGVFTFTRSPEAPAASAETTASKDQDALAGAEGEGKDEPLKNPLLAMDLPRRDPFAPPLSPVQPQGFQPQPTPVGRRPMVNFAPPKNSLNTISLWPESNKETGVEEVTPVKVPEPELPFSYTVSGVVIGRRPAVVFRDSQGNQKLVTEGASLDGDTTVTAVKLTHVGVLYRGKKLRLPIGGEPVAKQ
jgi:hypothetical protein